MGVYIYQSGVEKPLKNAYIGEYRVPGANTLLYMPLNGNIIDEISGNSGTGYGTQTYVTLDSGIQVYHGNSSHYAETPVVAMNTAFTLNVWLKRNSNSGEPMVRNDANASPRNFYQVAFSNTNLSDGWYYNGNYYGIVQAIDTNWHNHTLVCDSGGVKVYLDGTNIYTNSSIPSFVRKTQKRGINLDQQSGDHTGDAYYSKIIMENKGRVQAEIANYYNSTKSNYGL